MGGWFASSMVFNAVCIYRTATWTSSMFERRLCRLACFLIYAVPVALVDPLLFVQIVGVFAALASCFVFNHHFEGWGHTLCHLLLIPFAHCLLTAGGEAAALRQGG